MEVPHLCDDPLGMKNSHRPDPKHDVHLTEAAYSKQQAGQESGRASSHTFQGRKSVRYSPV